MNNLPKTRQELFKELGLPDNETSNKALSDLIAEGLVEKTKDGYGLSNPYGARVAKKVYETGKYKGVSINDE